MLSCGLSHFLENPSTMSQIALSLGTGFPTRVCGHPCGEDVPSGCCVPHFSLSPEDLIFWGCPPYLSSGQAFTLGVGLSQIPSDSPLGCLLANLGALCLMPNLRPQKLIFLYNQAWPQYTLDNTSKWPLNGTFDPRILRDLYNLCEHAGKWKELSYIQSFPYLCIKPSPCTFCSPVQILLACKSVSKSTNSSPKPPPSPCKQTFCTAYHTYLLVSS
jgi:hypothetical protein